MGFEEGSEDETFNRFQLSRVMGDFWSAGYETTATTLRFVTDT